MPAERPAEMAEKGWLAQTKENYRALRKSNLGPAKSLLLASKPGFHPGLLREVGSEKLASAFAEKSEAAMEKFGGTLKEFFQPFTRDEFTHYLMVSKRMSPVRAHYEAWVRGKSSPYYRREKESAHGFALRNWANWKADQVTQILFDRDYNRERNDTDAWADAKEHVANALVHGVNSAGVPRLDLKVFWGGQKEGGSGEADENERKVLDRLKALANHIGAKGVDVSVNLLFSDLHSTAVNEVDRERIEKYHASMAKLAEKYGFGLTRTLPLWKANHPYDGPDRDKHAAEAAKVMIIGAERGLIGGGAKSAEKHAQAVAAGEKTPEQMSEIYQVVASLEKPVFDKLRAPDTLYVSFDDPKNRSNKPEHTLHLWAFQRGRADRPWFKKAE